MNLSISNNYIVYKHTTPSGKVYIGITSKTPTDRWAGGFGYEHQPYFFRAIVKYGWINIKHEILYENLTKEEAETIEIRLIKEHNSTDINCGYNIDLGGNLHKLSKEARENISKAKIGKKWTERQRMASLEYFKRVGRKKVNKFDSEGNIVEVFKSYEEAAADAGITPKAMQMYISKGKFPSKWDYTYAYIGKTKPEKGEPRVPTNVSPVDMFDLSLNFVRSFSSIAEANRFLGVKSSHIDDVCLGHRLKCHNYIWRYHNEDKDN